ncbi:gp53-like domain-containing protein [Pseudomonas sp. TH31]|uniref:gp53-like domain-containing protein n=1 Tax=Pseudomonas sp. TH31 TaxID=2796396 RepID=UPI00406CC7E8
MAVFRRLLLAPGWSLDTGDAALKYSPLFKSSLKASGYQANPSGMLDQWGIGQADASGNVYVTFPISFPVGFSSIVGNHEGGDIAVVILASGSQTKQGCTLKIKNLAGQPGVNWAVHWRAVGY